MAAGDAIYDKKIAEINLSAAQLTQLATFINNAYGGTVSPGNLRALHIYKDSANQVRMYAVERRTVSPAQFLDEELVGNVHSFVAKE